MENENKNTPRHNQGEGKKHHRPKAYYIEPKKPENAVSEAPNLFQFQLLKDIFSYFLQN